MTKATVPAVALLPVRLFFGVTFLWAGLDKLLDPTFFDASAPTSLHAQLEAFARLSPLAPLIRASLPLAIPIGLTIAVAELGVGIGTLTGIAFRVAAAGGAALSLLFFLTASWPTRPYYIGADLPYLAGFVALALAGHGNVLVPERFREGPVAQRPTSRRDGFSRSRRAGPMDAAPSPERRTVLQAGLLAALAAIVASLAPELRVLGFASGPAVASPPSAGPVPSPGSSTESSAGPSPGSTAVAGSPATAGDLDVGTVSQVQRSGSLAFTVPFDAPAPLPAGDPGILVELADHSFVAFDAICTHAGCTVEYDAGTSLIFCPCHGAEFDPAHGAAVLAGPTRTPLAKLPLTVDQATGTISLAG